VTPLTLFGPYFIIHVLMPLACHKLMDPFVSMEKLFIDLNYINNPLNKHHHLFQLVTWGFPMLSKTYSSFVNSLVLDNIEMMSPNFIFNLKFSFELPLNGSFIFTCVHCLLSYWKLMKKHKVLVFNSEILLLKT
jgi:hypothetical protein